MNELPSKWRAVIDAARSAGGSTPEDRERVFAALASRSAVVAATAAVPSSASGAPATASASSALAGAKIVVAVALITSLAAGVGVALWLRSRPGAAAAHASAPRSRVGEVARTNAAVRVESTAAVEHPATALAIVPPPTTVSPPSVRVSAATVATRSEHTAPVGTLAEELALLRGARAAIRDHDHATAIALLEQHIGRFPRGMLKEEARATLVVALSGAGRHDEASRAAHRFLVAFPHSPYAERVRQSCIGETP